ncbi:MAG: hypothetical protein U0746_07590 [Gemmataceae bacterium]
MRIRSFWAFAAIAAAGVGFYVGTVHYDCSNETCAVLIPACGEESDGPAVLAVEAIDLTCVEPVLPYDLFSHTSEPPLAGTTQKSDTIVPVVYELPDFEGPALPVLIPECKDDQTPRPLPKGLESQGTDLPTTGSIVFGNPFSIEQVKVDLGKPPSGEKPQSDEFQSGSPVASGQCPCCEKEGAQLKPLPAKWFVGPPAPSGNDKD